MKVNPMPGTLQMDALTMSLPLQGRGPRSHRKWAVGWAFLPLVISCPLLTEADVNQNEV